MNLLKVATGICVAYLNAALLNNIRKVIVREYEVKFHDY